MRWTLLVTFLISAGCSHTSLTREQQTVLAQPADRYGELIYVGTVTPEGGRQPAFRYERRVLDRRDGARVSTHVTFVGATPVVLQRATQDSTGRLLAFDEVHGHHGDTHHMAGGVVVVGPTLFEFVRTHLPELRAGNAVPLEFWNRGSAYAFTLTLRDDTVEMRASSFFVRLGIAPMTMRLGSDGRVVAYHGRIPPLVDGDTVDADVTYEYAAATFR